MPVLSDCRCTLNRFQFANIFPATPLMLSSMSGRFSVCILFFVASSVFIMLSCDPVSSIKPTLPCLSWSSCFHLKYPFGSGSNGFVTHSLFSSSYMHLSVVFAQFILIVFPRDCGSPISSACILLGWSVLFLHHGVS